MPNGITTVDFSAGMIEASVVVIGQSGLLATSIVAAELRRESTATNSVDDLYLDPIEVWYDTIIPGTGFTLRAAPRAGLAFGQYKIDWAWG